MTTNKMMSFETERKSADKYRSKFYQLNFPI